MRRGLGLLLAAGVVLASCSTSKRPAKHPDAPMRISGIASVHSDSTTSIVVSFEDANGAPAALPVGGSLEMREDVRVLRVRLPDRVKHSAFADKAFETGLVSRAYVVGCLDGSVAIDLHLASAASARAVSGDVMAPLTIQLSRGGPELPPPTTSKLIVLLSPREGATNDQLSIEGYALAAFEGEVMVSLRGAVLRDTFIRVGGDDPYWGEFRLTWPRNELGPSDSLFVSDGMDEAPAWTGISVPLSRH